MVDTYFRDFIVFFRNPTCKKFGHLLHYTFTTVYYIVTQTVLHSHI